MISSKDDIAILILAAGASTRMGSVKQLLPWNNSTLLENAISMAVKTTARDVITVLGANASVIQEKIKIKGSILLKNQDWHKGIGSSIACGIRVLNGREESYQGILIMLADQPMLGTEYLNKMIDTFLNQKNQVVATNYKGRAGVPAIFGASYFKELTKLTTDFGAKNMLDRDQHLITILDPDGKTADIDTPEDYKNLHNND